MVPPSCRPAMTAFYLNESPTSIEISDILKRAKEPLNHWRPDLSHFARRRSLPEHCYQASAFSFWAMICEALCWQHVLIKKVFRQRSQAW